jgi:hypothetical protein
MGRIEWGTYSQTLSSSNSQSLITCFSLEYMKGASVDEAQLMELTHNTLLPAPLLPRGLCTGSTGSDQ